MIGSAQRLPGHLASGTGSTLRLGWDQARPRALDVVYPGSSSETSTGAYRLWSLCPQWHHNEGDPRHPFVGGRVWDEGVKWTGYCSYQREQANDSFTCSRNLVLRCLSLLPIELLEIRAVQEVMS